MSISTISFSAAPGTRTYACNAEGDCSGEYVRAADALQVEEALRNLIWAVHYAAAFDASNAAFDANIVLSELKAAA